MIEHGRSHADQAFVLDPGAVNVGVVADRDVVADDRHRTLVQRVDDYSVLDVDPVADRDFIDVAAQHGAEPDATVPADRDVADDRGVFRQKRIFSDYGRKAPQRFDKCHNSVF